MNTQELIDTATTSKGHLILKHTLLSDEGTFILEPSDALEAADFEAVINDMDPYLAKHNSLAGLMIFPVG